MDMNIQTMADVKAAKTADLVSLYNKYTGKQIKKFENRETAEKRTWEMVKERQESLEDMKSKRLPQKVEAATELLEIAQPTEESKRAEYNSRIIEILVEKHPKKPGTVAYKKFEILMNFNGKTIGEYREEEGKHPELDKEHGWPSTELRWAISKKLVKVPARVK